MSTYLLDFLLLLVSSFFNSYLYSSGPSLMSSLPPLPDGGSVPEAAFVAESEATNTGTTPVVDDVEEEAHSEASHTKASPPSATSHVEQAIGKKWKRMETIDVSKSSGESIPTTFSSSSYVDDPFSMAQIMSK
jgi:hypothetical protein